MNDRIDRDLLRTLEYAFNPDKDAALREQAEGTLRKFEKSIEMLSCMLWTVSPDGPKYATITAYCRGNPKRRPFVEASLKLFRSSAEEAKELLWECVRKSESFLASDAEAVRLISRNLDRVDELTDTATRAFSEFLGLIGV